MKAHFKTGSVLLFFMFSFFLPGCRKIWESESITGTVRDDSTAVALSGVTVRLYHYPGSNNYSFLDETFTSAEGKFKIENNIRKGHRYLLTF